MIYRVHIVMLVLLTRGAESWWGSSPRVEEVKPPAIASMPGIVTKYFEDAGGMLTAKSECLASAAIDLPDRCSGMSDTDYSRFAVALTNCHLAKSGRKTYECNPSDSVERCTRRMDDAAFGAYTTICTHVHSMCQQLQQEMRAMAADDALAALAASTGATAVGLEKLGSQAESIAVAVSDASRAQVTQFERTSQRLDGIDEAAKRGMETLGAIVSGTADVQRSVAGIAASHAEFAEKSLSALGGIARATEEAALAHGRFAETAVGALGSIATTTEAAREDLVRLAGSHAAVAAAVAGVATAAIEAGVHQRELLEQQRQLAAEQRALGVANREIMDSVARLSWLQTAIFGEILDVKAVAWYVAFAALCYFVTSTERTASARIYTIVGLIATLFAERALNRLVLSLASDPQMGANLCCVASSGCRMAFLGYAGTVVVWKALVHRDGNKTLLEELQLNRAMQASLADVFDTYVNKTR
jgi:hypothetical protein